MSTNDTSWDDEGFEAEGTSFGASASSSHDPIVPDAHVPAPEPSVEPVPEPLFVTPPVAASVPTPAPEPVVRRVEVPRPTAPPTPLQEPKKRRGAMFWTSVVAATLLIVALGGSIVWYATRPDPEEELLYAPTDEPVEAQQETPAVVDTQQVTVVDTPMVVREESKPTEQPARPKPMKPIAAKEEPPPVIKKEAPPKPETPPVVKKEQPSPKAPQMTTTPPPNTKAKPLYVVQVFSSPSKDDAEEWLQSLREKKVNDGYITEQQIKGQPWYRVRFGQYEKREDAESAAMNMGFTQPWVARIR